MAGNQRSRNTREADECCRCVRDLLLEEQLRGREEIAHETGNHVVTRSAHLEDLQPRRNHQQRNRGIEAVDRPELRADPQKREQDQGSPYG